MRGNGLPIAGTPLDTSNDTRLFYNTITALGFERGGNGITLEDYQENNFYLVFYLTSTTEANKSLTFFPELTGAGITFKLSFSKALPEAVELFFIGERFSQILLLTILEIFQRIRRWSRDNFSLFQLADNCCPKLFKKFTRVASSDNFFSGRDFEEILDSAVTTGQKLFYQNVYSAGQTEAGQPWLLLSYILIDPSKNQAVTCSGAIITIVLWDPLGEPSKLQKNSKTISCLFIANDQSI